MSTAIVVLGRNAATGKFSPLPLDASQNVMVDIVASSVPLTVSGAITVTGIVTVANNPGDALVSALADTDGNLVGVTDNALDVHLKQEDAVSIQDSTGQPILTTLGAVNVAVQGSLSVSSIVLAPNAAQESGGNLAIISAMQTSTNALIVLQQASLDMLRQTNATLNSILMVLEASSTNAYFDRDDSTNAEVSPIN